MPWAPDEPDAIQLLEADHRRLEKLLEEGEQTTEGSRTRRSKLLDTITSELTVHELIEEKLLYPALKSHPEATDIVLEGYQEHHVADLLVKELHGLSKADERWGAKFKVLQESIQHHIDEEEGEMFRTARAVMSRDELRELGARMAEMKSKAQETRGRR
jgi:hemerythrin-like domain-containing protein